MMLGSEAVGTAIEMIDATGFYRTAHQKIFNAIVALHNRGERADSITVSAELRRRDDFEVVGGAATLAHILEYGTTTANLREHCTLVREAARKRRLRDLGLDLVQRAEDPANTSVELIAHLDAAGANLASERLGVGRFAAAALDARDLATLEIPRPRTLLGDGVLTAGGLGILYGLPSLGKSWLALLLARALVRGEPWLGIATAGDAVRVGVLQLELPAYALQARLLTLGIGAHERDAGLRVICRPGLKGAVDLLQPNHLADLRAWVKCDGLDVVMVDALSRAHRADENSAKEFGPVLASLDAMRHETGAAVLAVHHEPKPRDGRDPDDDLNALRGTSRLASDPTLLVRVVQSRGLRCIRFAKVSEAAAPDPVWFRIGEDGTPVVVDSPESVRDGNREKVLRVVLEAERSLPNKEIATRVGMSLAVTRKHLSALVEAGEIHVEGENKDTRYTRSPARPAHDAAQAGELPLIDNELGAESPLTRSRSPLPTRSPASPAPPMGESGSERVGEAAGGPPSGLPQEQDGGEW